MEENKTSIGSVIATIIIIALIVLGGLYFWGKRIQEAQSVQTFTVGTTTIDVLPGDTNTATTTADWKTYSSPKYGFSFSYPSAWQVSEKISKNGHKYIALSSGVESADIKGVQTEEIDFFVVNKSYFTPPIGTKVGMIGYDR